MYTVCFYCRIAMRFTEDLGFVACTEEDLVELFMAAPEQYMLLRKVQRDMPHYV